MIVSMDRYLQPEIVAQIPVPDWTHLKVESLETILIDWDNIHIDHELNAAKMTPHSAEEINSLRISFSEGVSIKEFPPAVIDRGEEYTPRYQLIYGFGRSEALRELKSTKWAFTVLRGAPQNLADVQAQENEGHMIQRINKESDMRYHLTKCIRDGWVQKNKKDIQAKFKLVYPSRTKEVMNRVVAQVLEAEGIEEDFTIYTSTTNIKDWLKNKNQENYVVDGEYDKERGMYGVTMKEGYQYRTVLAAIKKYAEEGKKTYVIFHCSAPTKKATLAKKRANVVKEFNNIQSSFSKLGMNVWPIHIMGALPQNKEKDKNNVFLENQNLLVKTY